MQQQVLKVTGVDLQCHGGRWFQFARWTLFFRFLEGRNALTSPDFPRVLAAGLGAFNLFIAHRLFSGQLFGSFRTYSGSQLMLEAAASMLCIAAITNLWFVVQPTQRRAGYVAVGLYFLSFALLLIGGGVSLYLLFGGMTVLYLLTQASTVAEPG